MLDPFLTRLNALTDAVRNVYHHQPGAWTALALESAKIAAIGAASIGVSCLAGVALSAAGLATISGGIVATLAASIFTSRAFCQQMNRMEEAGVLVAEGIRAYTERMFKGDSNRARLVRERCNQEAESLVQRMNKMSAYQEFTENMTARRLFQKHWANIEKAQAYEAEFESYLQQSKAEREEVVTELLQQVELLKLVELNISQADDISKDNAKLAQLQANLKNLGIQYQAPKSGLAYFLLNIKEQATTALIRQTGTDLPGENTAVIMDALVEFRKEVFLGQYTRDMVSAEAIEAAKTESEAEFNTEQTARLAAVKEERVKLVLQKVLTDYVELKNREGVKLTAADLKNTDILVLLQPEIDREMAVSQTVDASWINTFKGLVSSQQLMTQLTEKSREKVLAAATQGVIGAAAA